MTTATPTRGLTKMPKLPPRLPEAVTDAPAAIAKPATAYLELRERTEQTCHSLRAAERAVTDAEQADRAALVDAVREGDEDPGRPAVAEAQAKVETLSRELVGLTDATQLAWREFFTALAEHSETWHSKVCKGLTAKEKAARTDLDGILDQINGIATDRAVLDWLAKAARSANGEQMGGSIPYRFPRSPNVSTSIAVGQTPQSADWLIALLRSWLVDGEGG